MADEDYTGLDPDLARGYAATLRAGRDTAEDVAGVLAPVLETFHLHDELSFANVLVGEAAQELGLAATDLDLRATYVELLDRPGPVEPDGAGYEVLIQLLTGALDSSLGDDVGVPAVAQWATSLSDLEDRLGPSTEDWPHASAFCAAGAGYWSHGSLTGPDGLAYEVVVPYANVDGVLVNGDLGDPDGPRITDLLGNDPGWTTEGVEHGYGHVGDPPGLAEQIIVTLGGAAGAPYDAHYAAVGRPAPEEYYRSITVDDDFVPVGLEPGRPIVGPPPEEAPDPANPDPLALNALTLVNQTLTGVDAAQSLSDATLAAYAVEYQVNADGRRRALIHAYQFGLDADGEVLVTMGYGGLGDDGLVGFPLQPRVDGEVPDEVREAQEG